MQYIPLGYSHNVLWFCHLAFYNITQLSTKGGQVIKPKENCENNSKV